jgi:NADP-dependent 3-hydroxy acid dehydrogenase YdfG
VLPLKNKIAVVTGASSGIGKSIALELAKEGVKLCLLGRNPQRLEVIAETAGKDSPLVKCYAVDLAKDADIKELQQKLNSDFEKIHILIHSAGLTSLGRLEFSSVGDFDRQYQTNVRAPFLLTQTLLPMLKSGKGQIVFINSSAGLKAGLNNGQYAATKSALKSIADSFRNELNTEGIRVLSVYPGRTATPMQETITKKEGREYYPELLLQSEDIAVTVVNAIRMPRSSEITDIHIRPFLKSY